MNVTDRTQFDREDLAAGGEGIRRGSEKGAAIYSVIAAVLAIGLCVVAVAMIDSWAQWLVLGVIVMTMVGFMIAVSPNRRS
ncbi:MAG: hypothetical protein EXQ70_04080 [Solirubrobacterales bacterium]|nr:hypothetical protein [Solirubrobacterales bacterium]